MKKILLILSLLFLVNSVCYAGDVKVRGYYRKDGTYVRPYHRSSPDGDVSNNYGRPSYQQQQQYKYYQELPSYNYDYDNDGIKNKNDSDDDNDGTLDNYDSRPYNPKVYSSPTYTPPTYDYYDYRSRPSTRPSIYNSDDSDDNDSSRDSDSEDSEYDSDNEYGE